jgi:predicted PolB exonuclease-like 3'-5' exonuclease
MKKELFIDIETIPEGELDDFELYKEAPKNLKDPEKIKKWEEEAKEEQFLKQAVDTNRAKILTIGAAFDNSQPECFIDFANFNERDVLNNFEKYLKNNLEELIKEGVSETRYVFHDVLFIGHNIKKFDLQLLYVKALKYEMPYLAQLVAPARKRYNNGKSFDLMEEWNAGDPTAYISLDNISKTLGIQGKKGDMDGSKVYEKYKEGLISEIVTYQKDDIILTRNVYNRMKISGIGV